MEWVHNWWWTNVILQKLHTVCSFWKITVAAEWFWLTQRDTKHVLRFLALEIFCCAISKSNVEWKSDELYSLDVWFSDLWSESHVVRKRDSETMQSKFSIVSVVSPSKPLDRDQMTRIMYWQINNLKFLSDFDQRLDYWL
jgi:hypothetical protein